MKVRKLLVTDIRCRTCDAGPGERCHLVASANSDFLRFNTYPDGIHGERIAEHAELERAGWEWQEVNPTDKGAR